MSALENGGHVGAIPSSNEPLVYLQARDHRDNAYSEVYLTRIEAIGLAQQLLKAANAPEAVA